jgi:hypothetical protein
MSPFSFSRGVFKNAGSRLALTRSFRGWLNGLELCKLMSGKASAVKCVYKIADTKQEFILKMRKIVWICEAGLCLQHRKRV